jgi:hypothetical protein
VGIPKSKRNEILTLTFTPPLRTRPPSCQPELCPEEPHVWQRRFYDFNPWSERKRIEKLRYMHRTPVKRGVVLEPEQCQWSSYRTYAYHEQGRVKINQWTKAVMKVRAVA